MILPHSVKCNRSDHKRKLFQLRDVVKLIFNKTMSLNVQFVGQQVCKQSQTHACVLLWKIHHTEIFFHRTSDICCTVTLQLWHVIRRYEVRRGVFDLQRRCTDRSMHV